MRNMQGTPEHDDVARATASVVGERDEKKRPGLELGWKREGGDTGCIPPPPESTTRPWIPPFTLAPGIPSLVLPLALVAPPFATLDLFSRQILKQDDVQGLTPNNPTR